jgi:hypothetical protein
MSYLYEASKAYQEQLLRDAQPDEAGSEVEPRQRKLDAALILKILRSLRQAKAAQEGQSAPPAWMKT